MKILRPLFDRGFYWLLYPPERRAAHRVLRSTMRRNAIASHLRRTHRDYLRQAADLEPLPTLGARVMVRAAVVAVATYRSLRGHGFSDLGARRLTAAITWRIYRTFAGLPWVLTRLFAKDPLRRFKRAMTWFMRFPYASPGYEMEWIPTDDKVDGQVVGFDVRYCPAAAYFRSRELSALCTDAFCDLDYPLADLWSVRLERETTIAKGCNRCEFRYRHLASGTAQSS